MVDIDTLLFNLDGTLLDTRGHTLVCANAALIKFGEKPIEAEDVNQLIGLSLSDTFRAVLPHASVGVLLMNMMYPRN